VHDDSFLPLSKKGKATNCMSEPVGDLAVLELLK